MKNKDELLPLTSVRFFLAAWVVIFHQTNGQALTPAFLLSLPTAIYNVLRTGYIAVGVFFVLSGFVLSLNYPLAARWSKRSLLKFAIARLSRIYPVYLLGLLMVAPVVLGPQLAPFSLPGLARKLFSGALNLLMLQAWHPRAALTWNGPGWSLSNELFFYCCFPFVGLWLWKMQGIAKCLWTLIVLWAAELALPVLAVLTHLAGYGTLSAVTEPGYASLWAGVIKFNPLLQLPLFCSGIITGRIFVLIQASNPRWTNRGFWLYLPGITAVLAIVSLANQIRYPLLHNGLLLPAFCMVILGFGLNGGIMAKLLSHRFLVFLGRASYSQYILQFPVRLLFVRLTRNRIGGIEGATLQFALLLAVSSMVYHFMEEPAQQILKKRGRTWIDKHCSEPLIHRDRLYTNDLQYRRPLNQHLSTTLTEIRDAETIK